MTDPAPHDDIPDDEDALFEYLAGLVEQARQVASLQANATLTTRNWLIGRAINVNVLRQKRTDYGKQIVAALGQQLSWSHIRELLPVKSEEARTFYVEQAVIKHLDTRDLHKAIARKAYERRKIANAQIPEGSAVPRDTFTDPMILDLLGLHDSYTERDLEAAIIHDMRDFLMEVGQGFTFVASQIRMSVSDDTEYRLDLLFFARPLRRLVAVELKLGPFQAKYEGRMKGYLKWLDRYERGEGEDSPLGLILCTASDREEIELLKLHKDGIMVVEYWTILPPKAELEAKLGQIVRDAQERLAHRGITASPSDFEDDDE